ncbi:hypothetical protein LTR85_008505 [Meristemomyces frigidus]|nr:hypothetical protein LTR85_008505 [Meristemomyces frigidus]
MLYDSLPLRHIRLLTLTCRRDTPQPVEQADADSEEDNSKPNLVCTLDVAALEQSKQYDALSYVWGSSKAVRTVLINGQRTSITLSLFLALQHLQLEEEDVVLWIDQLCINQADAAERSSQVTLMGEIYARAARVVAWLGEADGETESVWRLLDDTVALRDVGHVEMFELAKNGRIGSEPGDICVDGAQLQLARCTAMRTLQTKNPTIWVALRTLLNRPWFTRVWVFQEVAVARDCSIWCGAWRRDWTDLIAAVQVLDRGGFLDQAGLYTQSINIGALTTIRGMYATGRRSSLLGLLSLLRTWEATLQQDRVFAIRALVEQACADDLDVDYHSHISETYASAARACILHDQSLAVLGEVEVRRQDPALSRMPCWVPDWRSKTSTNVQLNFRSLDSNTRPYFQATLGTPPRTHSTGSGRSLALEGFEVAKITRIVFAGHALHMFDPCISARDSSSGRWKSGYWRMIWRDAVVALDLPDSCLAADDGQDAYTARLWHDVGFKSGDTIERKAGMLSRTLLADLQPGSVRSRLTKGNQVGLWPAFMGWQARGFPSPPPAEVLNEHDCMVKRTMFNRYCFIAEDALGKAYLGMTLSTMEIGDRVCLLYGGDTPFVLRLPGAERGSRARQGIRQWEFVAECYIHGIMDGEAVRDRAGSASDEVFAVEHYHAEYDRLARKPMGW